LINEPEQLTSVLVNESIQSEDLRDAVILFVDVVGSARLSDVLPPKEHDRVMGEFQNLASDLAEKVASDLGTDWCKIDIDLRGDQLVFIAVLEHGTYTARRVLQLAVALGLGWMFADTNRGRIRNGLAPIRLSMGLHFGPVVFREHPRFFHTDGRIQCHKVQTPEGFSINFAKRVESASRNGRSSGIILSQSMLALSKRLGLLITVGPPLSSDAKGFETAELMYELEAQDFELPDFQRLATRLNSGSTHCLRALCSLIAEAFQRDPVRMNWVVRSLLEYLFQQGSESWETGKTLAEAALNSAASAEWYQFELGRFCHKLGWSAQNPGNYNRPLLDEAIVHLRAARKGSAVPWATGELAMIHLRLFEFEKANREQYLRTAQDFAAEFVREAPDHYYSYFLNALICGVSALEDRDQLRRGTIFKEREQLNERCKNLIDLAKQQLAFARILNQKPIYLEFAQVTICDALGDFEDGDKCVMRIEQWLSKEDTRTDNPVLAPDEFSQSGVCMPNSRPPRLKSFQNRVTLLKDERAQRKREEAQVAASGS
jgi:class 3 adenylate cyclase